MDAMNPWRIRFHWPLSPLARLRRKRCLCLLRLVVQDRVAPQQGVAEVAVFSLYDIWLDVSINTVYVYMYYMYVYLSYR